jgi:Cyclin, N-terminal domain
MMQSNRCMSAASSAVLPHAISGMKTGDFEDTMEHLCAMRNQESDHYPICPNYLDFSSLVPPGQVSERVNEGWRRKICEWSYEVVDHFNFEREVVSVALRYLDLVVSIKTEASGNAILRRDFQLIAVTSLYVAIKLHGESDATEGPRRKLKISAFVELSRGLFQVETLEAEERIILAALKWHVNPPTTVRFVATYLRLLPQWSNYDRTPVHSNVSQSIFELSRYLTELSVCVSAFTFRFNSSCIAYAALLAAMDALHDTVSLAYDVRVAFLNNIAACMNMTPQMAQVRQCKTMLMELCPTMFEHTAPEADIGLTRSVSILSDYETAPSPSARTSPVCVVDELKQDLSPGKRRRISES